MIKIKHISVLAAICASALLASGCGSAYSSSQSAVGITDEVIQTESSENSAVSNSVAFALKNSSEGEAYNEPFTSYTYDFSVFSDNFMITVTPDETNMGLVLTVEDNQFGFTTFNVTPPANYMVCLPFSQEYASQVCTVIKSADGNKNVPDLLKIDFYLSNFDDETLPYTVTRLYSILDQRLVEVEVYNTAAENGDVQTDDSILEPMDYIPDSYLYQTENLKFMPAPAVTVNEDGSLSAKVVTYALNPNDMTMRRAVEECTLDNPLYYGYAAHAMAGNVYQYFIATSLNVTDYENYVEIPVEGSLPGVESAETSEYYFKVDDPRFSTVAELREYAERYFDKKIVDNMFITAPQKYRDIDGALYTILGDGGMNDTLGKLTITDWEIDGNTITYHTKQEKFNDAYEFDGYIDGGNFVIEISDDGSKFIVKEYRYPFL